MLPSEFVRDPERIRGFEQEAKAAEAKKHADESVAKGREIVAAYVELTHYAEWLQADATSAPAPDAHSEPGAAHEH